MKNELTYENINRARKLLELGEEASLKEIESSYRKLSLKYHPDRCREKDKKVCEEKFKQITLAYELIITYCRQQNISFKKEDIEKGSAHEEYKNHMERFYKDWWF